MAPRAQVTAEQVAQLSPNTAVVVRVIEDLDNPAWTRKAIVGELEVGRALAFEAGTLRAVAENKALTVFEGGDLQRADYAHLDVRRTIPVAADDRIEAIAISAAGNRFY